MPDLTREPETHPVQSPQTLPRDRARARVPVAVSLRAYEVYTHLYGKRRSVHV